jgi:NADH-quinone oxidoreductase subunit M
MAIDHSQLPLLSLLIFLPLTAAFGLWLVRGRRSVRYVALAAALLELAVSVGVVASFDFDSSRLQFLERHAWIPNLNIHYLVGVDGISVLFLPLTALLTLCVIIATWNGAQALTRLYFSLLLALESVTLGVFCALDLALFFVFWELTLVPIYFLVSLWGMGPQRRYAAMKYTLVMLAGGIPLLFGIVLLALAHADSVGLPASSGLAFDYFTLLQVPVASDLQMAIFLLLFFGFAVKAPLFPFHTWLPTMAMEGPAGLTAMLVGLKLGAYGLIRFAVPLAPGAAKQCFWLVAGLGALGLIYGALVALRQTNLRRLLAYSSVSHVGLVVMGIATLNVQGAQGAVFQLLNFAAVAAGLFLVAGYLQRRLGSTDLVNLGGLARTAPRLTSFFFLLGLAGMGVPGTSGFAAEHLILIGVLKAHVGLGMAGLLGAVLGAGYFLGYFQKAFFGPLSLSSVNTADDLRRRELAVVGALAGLALIAGFVPGLVTGATQSTVEAWVARIDAADPQSYADLSTGMYFEPTGRSPHETR